MGMVSLGLLGTLSGFSLPTNAQTIAVATGAISQASPAPPMVPNPVLLAPGANPAEVTILQQQLQLLGVYSGPINGDYSPATQEAVKAFQQANNLPATGLLDGETWDRMSTPQLLGDRASSPDDAAVPNLLATSPPAEPPAPESLAADGGAESAASESADPSTTSVEPAPAEEPAVLRWRQLAIPGGIALAGLLGAGLWWQSRRKRPIPADPTISDPATFDPASESPLPPQPSPVAQEASPSPPDPKTNGHALVSLTETTRLPSVNIVATLVEELASPDPDLRRRAIWELGQRGDSTAVQPLINGLLEADSQEKSLILAALSEISSRSLKPMHRALALGLQDPSPEVRKNAIRDLSRVYDTLMQLGPMLAHATQDPDPEVQATAQWALGQLNRLAPAPYSDPRSIKPAPSDRLPPSPPTA